MITVSKQTEVFINALNSLEALADQYDKLAEERPLQAKQYRAACDRCVSLRERIGYDISRLISGAILSTANMTEL